jgi:hypothetical protein
LSPVLQLLALRSEWSSETTHRSRNSGPNSASTLKSPQPAQLIKSQSKMHCLDDVRHLSEKSNKLECLPTNKVTSTRVNSEKLSDKLQYFKPIFLSFLSFSQHTNTKKKPKKRKRTTKYPANAIQTPILRNHLGTNHTSYATPYPTHTTHHTHTTHTTNRTHKHHRIRTHHVDPLCFSHHAHGRVGSAELFEQCPFAEAYSERERERNS